MTRFDLCINTAMAACVVVIAAGFSVVNGHPMALVSALLCFGVSMGVLTIGDILIVARIERILKTKDKP